TRPPTTTGAECPSPTLTFQAGRRAAGQVVGAARSAVTPSRASPRHCGQSPAAKTLQPPRVAAVRRPATKSTLRFTMDPPLPGRPRATAPPLQPREPFRLLDQRAADGGLRHRVPR